MMLLPSIVGLGVCLRTFQAKKIIEVVQWCVPNSRQHSDTPKSPAFITSRPTLHHPVRYFVFCGNRALFCGNCSGLTKRLFHRCQLRVVGVHRNTSTCLFRLLVKFKSLGEREDVVLQTERIVLILSILLLVYPPPPSVYPPPPPLPPLTHIFFCEWKGV